MQQADAGCFFYGVKICLPIVQQKSNKGVTSLNLFQNCIYNHSCFLQFVCPYCQKYVVKKASL